MASVLPTLDLTAMLRQHFGYQSFRAGQEDLVRAVLDGHDVLAVMPTGSGKSLGFQLPALLLPGLTLVVSPLISLMKDQVDELNRRGMAAAAIHSQVAVEARRAALSAARDGGLRLLYVAPERFASDHFARLLEELPVARFVIDEAHCVSEWGHDFRPDYRRLREAAGACRRGDGLAGRPPMAAFTATATPEVRDDIVSLLGLSTPRVMVSGFDRPNIYLRVRPVSDEGEKHELLSTLVRNRRSLVYAATRRNTEAAAATLQAAGVAAAAYHGGLSDAERSRVQDAFASGGLAVVCATNAFGMGIDRPDVEAVVHFDIPGSLEAYYQEIGRAGRDGREAMATLLWHYADVKTREFLIDREPDERSGRPSVRLDPSEMARRKDLEHKKLRRMVAYADAHGCLRATILRYFGDPAAHEPCGSCGACERRAPLDAEATLKVRKILSGVARAGERYGRRRIAAMLVGDVEELPEPLTRLSTTGLLRGEPPRHVEQWIDAACGAGLIRTSNDEYRTLSLTVLGREVMAGRVEEVRLAVPIVRRAVAGSRTKRGARNRRASGSHSHQGDQPPPALDAVSRDPELTAAVLEALRAWRLEQAKSRAIAPFIILHDRTLNAVALSLPESADDLLAVPGIGPAKIATYGEEILAAIARVRALPRESR